MGSPASLNPFIPDLITRRLDALSFEKKKSTRNLKSIPDDDKKGYKAKAWKVKKMLKHLKPAHREHKFLFGKGEIPMVEMQDLSTDMFKALLHLVQTIETPTFAEGKYTLRDLDHLKEMFMHSGVDILATFSLYVSNDELLKHAEAIPTELLAECLRMTQAIVSEERLTSFKQLSQPPPKALAECLCAARYLVPHARKSWEPLWPPTTSEEAAKDEDLKEWVAFKL
ncbi:hypothetical protein B0J14DRAFT_559226 [Halenospora varia]|nr:hypothetical protein B0J14DRAFT_559226 [Halenospora varia]